MIIPPGTGAVILFAVLVGFALTCLVLADREEMAHGSWHRDCEDMRRERGK